MNFTTSSLPIRLFLIEYVVALVHVSILNFHIDCRILSYAEQIVPRRFYLSLFLCAERSMAKFNFYFRKQSRSILVLSGVIKETRYALQESTITS